ncbi:MAG: DUF92 domain-containing protein [Tumebacillaceae bacterium]
MDWWIGLLGSVLIAGLAYWKRSLSLSGAVAAVVVGTLLYGLGSRAWFGTLILFFVSSSLLSKWKQKQKAKVEASYEKTGRRDAGQVLANGGLGVLLCIADAMWPHPLWFLAFVGVMASVNADTWATEIGGLSKKPPRSILSGKVVPAGTSGGVSAMGMYATFAGAFFIGVVAWLLAGGSLGNGLGVVVIGTAAGVVGSLVDSLLGACLQVMYRCETCGREVERREHCGLQTSQVRGLAIFNNDVVNLVASLIGGAVGALLGLVL